MNIFQYKTTTTSNNKHLKQNKLMLIPLYIHKFFHNNNLYFYFKSHLHLSCNKNKNNY
jgi:hypothetical protein